VEVLPRLCKIKFDSGDGRISEDEVKEVIGLSASANKLAP
jgi:hypothetical protein